MHDTSLWVSEDELDRLPAAYPAQRSGPGPNRGRWQWLLRRTAAFDVSHGELVSTAHDFYLFAQMLAQQGRVSRQQVVTAEHTRQMTSDQVPGACKTEDSFIPGLLDSHGLGFRRAVQTFGTSAGALRWSGGQGTNFFVDPDGSIGVLLTQVEWASRYRPSSTASKPSTSRPDDVAHTR
jgi:CubicO group peptidase (beta-lactamase class C family)